MLDDLKYIHSHDAQDALGIAEKQWQQLQHTFEFENHNLEFKHCTNVVYAGMGGSALAAQLSLSWPGYHLPFEIVRGYDIPSYVDSRTLFIACSYSGNTEETIAALKQAESQEANITVITSGGQLAEIAQVKQYPLLLLPSDYQPRHSVLFNLKALVVILERAGLVATKSSEESLHNASKNLRGSLQAWLPAVPTKDNYAKQLALEVIGKSAVIYAGPKLFPAAYKWKISFNENAKHIAWCNQYSELNHNEFLGWTEQPVDKPYAVIELRSHLEHPRIQKRFEVTERLLSGKRPAPLKIDVQGDNILDQLLWSIALGDFVTLYTALLNGLNPTPVDLIEKFKKVMNE